jgi:hypothetical protein
MDTWRLTNQLVPPRFPHAKPVPLKPVRRECFRRLAASASGTRVPTSGATWMMSINPRLQNWRSRGIGVVYDLMIIDWVDLS